MELNEAQLKIVCDIARIQTKDLTYILLKQELLDEIFNDAIDNNYEVTMKEVKTEVRKQLNQWAKVRKNPDLFGNLLDSTEKGWLRHHIFQYLMTKGHNDDTKGLWAKLNIDEQLEKLNLN